MQRRFSKFLYLAGGTAFAERARLGIGTPAIAPNPSIVQRRSMIFATKAWAARHHS
jgi:hypothetical protein